MSFLLVKIIKNAAFAIAMLKLIFVFTAILIPVLLYSVFN
jgi:hypothetical protein